MGMAAARAISQRTLAVNAPSASFPCVATARASPRAEREAEREIARFRRRGRQHQIAEAGKSHQGLGLRAVSGGEAAKLREPAGRERRLGAVAEAATFDDAGRDGEHVLRRPADLDAARIGRVVEPQACATTRRPRARPRAPLGRPRSPPRSAGLARHPARSSGRTGWRASRAASVCVTMSRHEGRVRARCPWRRR